MTFRVRLQMARDGLPCDTDATFRMACASVSHHARATGGRKFKVASKGTKLFDEAYRCRASSHSARQLLYGAGLVSTGIHDTRTRVALPWHVKQLRERWADLLANPPPPLPSAMGICFRCAPCVCYCLQAGGLEALQGGGFVDLRGADWSDFRSQLRRRFAPPRLLGGRPSVHGRLQSHLALRSVPLWHFPFAPQTLRVCFSGCPCESAQVYIRSAARHTV